MNRLLFFAAAAANTVLILAATAFSIRDYGRDAFLALLLALPPALALAALCTSPDIEERHLLRQVTKARLRKELRELDAGK